MAAPKFWDHALVSGTVEKPQEPEDPEKFEIVSSVFGSASDTRSTQHGTEIRSG